MIHEQKFKTKNGYCHILDDKILLTHKDFLSNIDDIKTENNIQRTLFIYSVFGLICFLNVYFKAIDKDWFFFSFYLIGGVILTYSIFRSLKLTDSPTIERDKIKNITFVPAKKYLTRSFFKIDFEQNTGKIKTRLVMLPGSLNDGSKETDKALEIMRNTGLLKQ